MRRVNLTAIFLICSASSGAAFACSPPAPVPEHVLKARADSIVRGEGDFSQRRKGGRVRPDAVLKGPARPYYAVDIDYRWSGPSSAPCPPMNALLGRQTGLFYLQIIDSGHFRIIGFDPR
jgi:hypothetical protein